MSFGRVITAMVTPFDQNRQIDFNQVERIADYLVNNGSDGLVVCGTTGESPTLSKDEKLKMFETVVKAVGGRAKVIAGTGTNNTASTIALTSEAEKLGVDGIMLVGPYYNKPSQEGYYQHFAAAAKATSMPIMIYNIPGRTGSNILPETIVRLAEIPNIISIKEAAGSLEQASELIRLLPEDFLIYSGDDSLTLPMMSIGAYGIVSVASHLAGAKIQHMIQAYLQGDVTTAANLHKELYPIFKGIFIAPNPVPVKYAMNLLGLQVGGVRLPLVEANEKEQAFLEDLLKTNSISVA